MSTKGPSCFLKISWIKYLFENIKQVGRNTFPTTSKFTVNDFENTEQFLDKLPTADGYDKAMEFRHPSWGTAAVMTDSPSQENLQFLSDVIVTANHSFIRFHGRNTKGRY